MLRHRWYLAVNATSNDDILCKLTISHSNRHVMGDDPTLNLYAIGDIVMLQPLSILQQKKARL